MSKLERRERKRADDGNAYVMIALGLVFLFVAGSIGVYSGVFFGGFPFLFPAAALLGKGLHEMQQRHHALPAPVDQERELLSAIRDNGGSITPAEAAMQTSLTVGEADRMLSELASGGHLFVEREGGALFYSLPGRRATTLEGGDQG